MKLKNALLLALTAFIWGTAFVAQSVGMEFIGPFTFNGIRSLIGALTLVPCILIQKKSGKRSIEEGRSRKDLIVGGLLCGILLFVASSLQQMRYLSVTEIAKKWDVSERSVRNYCAQGRVNGAFLTGKTWNIPENAEKPERSNKKKEQPVTLLDILQEQKASKYSGGIYHKTQIDLTYNSNHIEGSRLTHDQTRYIFETNTIGVEKGVLNVDDVIETANHFRCIDMIIDNAKAALTEKFIKELHLILKSGTSDSRKDWFALGDYKKIPNEVGGMDTALPEEVADKMKTLLTEYNGKEEKTFEDMLDFHVKFERIHPFQDGNGRVGRLIMFKECLKYNIVPFIIEDNLKMFYYRGLKEWNNEKGYLTDTCLTAQDKYKAYLDYFRIKY